MLRYFKSSALSSGTCCFVGKHHSDFTGTHMAASLDREIWNHQDLKPVWARMRRTTCRLVWQSYSWTAAVGDVNVRFCHWTPQKNKVLRNAWLNRPSEQHPLCGAPEQRRVSGPSSCRDEGNVELTVQEDMQDCEYQRPDAVQTEQWLNIQHRLALEQECLSSWRRAQTWIPLKICGLTPHWHNELFIDTPQL